MKLSIPFGYQYIIFISTALLFTKANFTRRYERVNEIKIEKKHLHATTNAAPEVLHGEMLYRF